MKILENLSFHYKLRLTITLTSGVVLLLASLAFVSTDIKNFRESMIRELLVLANLAGRNSTPGLLFNDADATRANLQVLQAEKRIMLAHIFDKKGDIFASYFAEKFTSQQHLLSESFQQNVLVRENLGEQAQPQDIPKQGLSLFHDGYLHTFIPLTFEDGALIGAVYIRTDTEQLQQRLFDAGKIVLIVLIIALVLAFVLAAKLGAILGRPVFHLLENMKVVARARDYSIRAEKMTNDELGHLTDGFNKMLEEIEKSHLKLEQYREHLEDMVEQRTAELAESRDQALAANQALQQRGEELAVARDEALAANDALQRRGEELAEARDAAESANRAKSAFLANMSHELRTPLNGILGYTQILNRDSRLNTDQKDGIDIIHRSGQYLLTLINDILDLSKIEAGRIELFPNDFSMDEFIRGLKEIFVIRAQEKNIDFVLLLGEDSGFDPQPLPVAVHADEKRLRQILLNLLSNAVKFTEKGQVRLKMGYNGTHIQCAVEDTGVGIANEDLDKIFAPFHQVGDVMHKAEGTGLGLAITQKLIDMMGGQLQVTSTFQQGSCFSFNLLLPVIEQAPETSRQAQWRTPTAYQLPIGQAPKTVMVVDDNAINRLLVRNFLQPLGFLITLIEDGIQALEHLDTQQPDVIIMDLIMPNMDGFECTQKIREHADPRINSIPIIVASASAFEADKQRSFALGATDFLTKPIEEQALQACLEKLLQLQWIYQDNIEQGQVDEAVLSYPTLEQQKVLQELTLLGDFRGLREALDGQLADNPELQVFAQIVHKLAKDFDEEGIIELLEAREA